MGLSLFFFCKFHSIELCIASVIDVKLLIDNGNGT